ncbi:hypothetical protein Cni_G01436 [Canna indica]|uniref:Uncharacterized protein n=1 Tax=Canna indica TaxID=4628 RepID=A0AAQ3PY86_9LILI|nr:hypothetical protein Cni_G01436 [Canna indica]
MVGSVDAHLRHFFEEAGVVKEMGAIRNLLARLQASNEDSKSLHNREALRGLRDRINVDLEFEVVLLVPDSINDDTAENQGGGSPSSMPFMGRAFFNLRRGAQVVSMEQGQEQVLDLFQSHVADRLFALMPAHGSGGEAYPLLSLAFLSKLLDALLSCEEEFCSLLGHNRTCLLAKFPADRAVDDLLDCGVKSLDV